jgi:hypothetical protein
MKCPKCQYLGFDTGDRCRNCGYDFSLLTTAEPDPAGDLPLRSGGDGPVGNDWLDDLDTVLQDNSAADLRPLSLTPDLVLPSLTPLTVDPVEEPASLAVDVTADVEPEPEPEVAQLPPMPAMASLAAMPASFGAATVAAAVPAALAANVLEYEHPLPPPSFRGEAALPLFSGDTAT